MKKLSLLFLFLGASLSQATTWYVDSQATGTNNGTSWANAWTSLASASGASVVAGDTVYISGGPSGSTRTYALGGGGWSPKSGSSSGGRITYQIGQDSAHNGNAVFTGSEFIAAGTRQYINIVGDAGDGNRHFVSQTGRAFNADNMNNTRIGYVDFGNVSGAYGAQSSNQTWGPNNELDHCFANKNSPDSNYCFYFQVQGNSTPSYTDNLIHDNYIRSVSSGIGGAGNYGSDAFSMSGQGCFSFYNNVLEGYVGTYTFDQHPDGIQCVRGDHIRIYNNYINNYDDIAIYFGAYPINPGPVGNYNDVAIYNNVIVNSRMGIEIGADDPSNSTITNCIIANNTIAITRTQESALPGCWFSTHGNGGPTTSGCIMRNNVVIFGTIQADFGNADATNVRISSPGNAGHILVPDPGKFVTWSTGLNGNWNLLATATDLINHGSSTGLTSYFTTDRAGNTRTGTWDIGAYEFGSGTDTTAPSLFSAVIPPAGTSIVLTFNENVQFGSGGNGGWTFSASPSITVGTPTVSTSTITFPITNRVVSVNESVTRAYTQPNNGVEDTAGNDLANVASATVTNSSTQGQVAVPTILLASGAYFGTQNISITSGDIRGFDLLHD